MKKASGLFLSTALVWAIPALVSADPPATREEMLRLVPKGYGFCLVLQDLKGHGAKWEKSALVKRIQQSPFFKTWLDDPGVQALQKANQELVGQLGLTVQEILDDILSEQVIFAFGPAARAEDEEGLLLVRARKEASLVKLLNKINELQEAGGELKELKKLNHRGVEYVRRVDVRQTMYYFLDGPFLALSEKQSTILEIIDQTRTRAVDPTSAIAKALTKAGGDKALAALWINPRSFDDELKNKARNSEGAEAFFLKSFQHLWQGMDGIVLSLHAEEEVQLRLTLLARVKDLPAAARPLFAEPTQVSKVWEFFPDSALAAMAGRLDLTPLGDLLGDQADMVQRQIGNLLGIEIFKDLLPNLGPDWGVCLLPPEGKHLIPQAIMAIRVQGGDKNIDKALYRGLDIAAALGVWEFNKSRKDGLRLTTIKQGDIEVKVLRGDQVFPAGFQPAFALKQGFLVIASTPSAIEQFRGGAGKLPGGKEVPVFRLSSVNLATAIRERRALLINRLAEKSHLEKSDAGRILDVTLAVLDLFDQVTLSQESGGGQLAWTLRLRPASD